MSPFTVHIVDKIRSDVRFYSFYLFWCYLLTVAVFPTLITQLRKQSDTLSFSFTVVSVVDYILVDQSEKSTVSDVTVIRNEPCLLQHKLLVCHLVVREFCTKEKENFCEQNQDT